MAISPYHEGIGVENKRKDSKIINDLNGQAKEELAPVSSEPEETGNGGQDSGVEEEAGQAVAAQSEELQALQALKDKYLRLAAEFENYKRIAQRDQREFSRFANENLLRELLPIVDNLERALGCAKEGHGREGLVQGVELTLKQFLETLSKFGVRPIVSVGEVFDPTRHQAVGRVEAPEKPDNSVVEELQKGYLLHERVLRAAMVTVATSPSGGGDRSSVKAEAPQGEDATSAGDTPGDTTN